MKTLIYYSYLYWYFWASTAWIQPRMG